MKKKLTTYRFRLCLIVWLGIAGTLAADTIEKIDIKGNTRVSRDTILFYMKSRPQGIYSKAVLKEDFEALWKTGFFENITIESSAANSGGKKSVTLTLVENPLIASIQFKTGKKVGEKDILEKLLENNIVLTAYSYYNPARMKRSEHVIRQMLVDKGYNQGTVTITTKQVKDRQIALTVHVVWGRKTRIGAIEFPGLEKAKISPGFLTNQLAINDYKLLQIEVGHLFKLSQMELHHRDPFDRLIISQSMVEEIPVVSVDKKFDLYHQALVGLCHIR